MAPRPELTLIVAATSKMGIGLKGTLPWAGLKREMAYFARVTKRTSGGTCGARNAVIMGRKTWDSIPPKFRPLKDRKNIIISRSIPPSSDTVSDTQTVSSIDDAINYIQPSQSTSATNNTEGNAIERAFIIGGAQIYKAALERPETKRILLTRILGEFECDTFFPVVLGEEGVSGPWKRRDKEELGAWTGEGENVGGEKEENGTKYVFEMWERE